MIFVKCLDCVIHIVIVQRNEISFHIEYNIFKVHLKRNLGIMTANLICIHTSSYSNCILHISNHLYVGSDKFAVHKFPNIANFRWFR